MLPILISFIKQEIDGKTNKIMNKLPIRYFQTIILKTFTTVSGQAYTNPTPCRFIPKAKTKKRKNS